MMLAWLRRIVVSIGIGGASFGIMLGIMILSIVYDRELEPVITYSFDTGRKLIAVLDGMGPAVTGGR
jgi:cyanate permease